MSTITHTRHIPVLLQEVLSVLNIQKTDTVLDGTLGGGGHAGAFASLLGGKGHFIGFDLDDDAIERAKHKTELYDIPKTFIKSNFRFAQKALQSREIPKVDKAFFDLGFSSDQLEVSGRGFSFQGDEPLLMTLNNEVEDGTLTAYEIVNSWQEENIADIIYGWGGERYSRRIAKAIVNARAKENIKTTKQLADIVEGVMPRRGKIHPATKTFQALRIAVNDEIGALSELLQTLPSFMNSGGIVAFLTFHSIEDRLVKQIFRKWAREEGIGTIVTKKPIVASDEEITHNPRARSAKLRAFKFN